MNKQKAGKFPVLSSKRSPPGLDIENAPGTRGGTAMKFHVGRILHPSNRRHTSAK